MSDQLTPQECARIRAYCEAATPGPWQEGIAGNANLVYFDGDDIRAIALVFHPANLKLIAVARTDLIRLLDAYEQVVLERDLERIDHIESKRLWVEDLRKDDRERIKLIAQVQELEAERNTPGEWICRTCSFLLHKRLLHAETGDVTVNTKDESELCPNDGATMRRLTWKEAAEGAEDAAERFAEEAHTLREERDALKAAAREVYEERFEGDWSPRWDRLRRLIEDV